MKYEQANLDSCSKRLMLLGTDQALLKKVAEHLILTPTARRKKLLVEPHYLEQIPSVSTNSTSPVVVLSERGVRNLRDADHSVPRDTPMPDLIAILQAETFRIIRSVGFSVPVLLLLTEQTQLAVLGVKPAHAVTSGRVLEQAISNDFTVVPTDVEKIIADTRLPRRRKRMR